MALNIRSTRTSWGRSSWQEQILSKLLAVTLSRLADNELKTPADQDAFKMSELFSGLSGSIFQELDSLKDDKFTDRKPAIGSLRRYFAGSILLDAADLALGGTGGEGGGIVISLGGRAPRARAKRPNSARASPPRALQEIAYRIAKFDKKVGDGNVEIDPYTRLHLTELSARIKKVLKDAHRGASRKYVACSQAPPGNTKGPRLRLAVFLSEAEPPLWCVPRRSLGTTWKNAMKLVIAVIQPTKLSAAVREALEKMEVARLTIADAQGFGRQRGRTEMYRGNEYTVRLLRKVVLEIVVNDDFLERTVNTIAGVARTGPEGNIGDGKIFVLPAEQAVEIDTAARGPGAV